MLECAYHSHRTAPYRTALNRSVPNRTELCVSCAISGTLEVRSKFAQGTVWVRYGCGTGAVRYFNFFMTDTVGTHTCTHTRIHMHTYTHIHARTRTHTQHKVWLSVQRCAILKKHAKRCAFIALSHIKHTHTHARSRTHAHTTQDVAVCRKMCHLDKAC